MNEEQINKVISIIRKIDCNKYLVTDFYEDNKVNAFWDLDQFELDLVKELQDTIK